jgi:hypothetical protein
VLRLSIGSGVLVNHYCSNNLVFWLTKYICQKAPSTPGKAILDDIDQWYGPFHADHKDAHHSFPELQWHHHLLVFKGFPKVKASSNGLGMIQRL